MPSIDFTWGSERANFEDESFDLVNNQGMMGDNDVEIWPVMLDDMFRVLKSGGLLLIAAAVEVTFTVRESLRIKGHSSRVSAIERALSNEPPSIIQTVTIAQETHQQQSTRSAAEAVELIVKARKQAREQLDAQVIARATESQGP